MDMYLSEVITTILILASILGMSYQYRTKKYKSAEIPNITIGIAKEYIGASSNIIRITARIKTKTVAGLDVYNRYSMGFPFKPYTVQDIASVKWQEYLTNLVTTTELKSALKEALDKEPSLCISEDEFDNILLTCIDPKDTYVELTYVFRHVTGYKKTGTTG